MSDDYLGAGGRLTGGPADELVRDRLRARDRACAAPGARGSRWPTWPTPWPWSRAAPWAARTPAGLLEGLLALDAIPAGEFPWRARARRRLQLARARAQGARGRVGGGLAQRRAAPPGGVPGRAAAVRPRGQPRPARRHARPGGGDRGPGRAPRRRPGGRLHLPPAGPADHDRPPAAGLRLPGAARRRAPVALARLARPERRGGGRQRRLALAARPRAPGRPARVRGGRDATPRTPCGRPTATSP